MPVSRFAHLIAAPRRSVIPPGDDVHIWTVRHDDARSSDEDADVLSDAEMARFNRFRDVRQRVRRIHARAALRHILSSYLGTNPARIVIDTGVHGKPSVAGVEFNCSHAPSVTVVAVAAQPVGVDIEPIGSCDGIDAFRHRFINDHDIAAMPPSRGSLDMLRVWVIKEACLKAIGTGLAIDPRELSVGPPSRTGVGVRLGTDALVARWLEIPGGHVAVVAARAPTPVVVHDEAHTDS